MKRRSIAALLLLTTAGCSAAAMPRSLDDAHSLMARQETNDLKKQRPKLMKEADEHLEAADAAAKAGNAEKANLEASIAIAKYKTAQNFVARDELVTRRRAEAEADQTNGAASAALAAADDRIAKVDASTPALASAKAALTKARDKQADAIREGAPSRAAGKFEEGRTLVDLAIDQLAASPPQPKEVIAHSEKAVVAFDLAIAEAKGKGATVVAAAPPPSAAPPPAPVPARPSTNDTVRQRADQRIVELELRRAELLGQGRDEACKAGFKELDATLAIAKERYRDGDIAGALEIVTRAGERLRVCDNVARPAAVAAVAPTTATQAAVNAERNNDAARAKGASTAIQKAQEQRIRAEANVGPDDKRLERPAAALAKSEQAFDRGVYEQAELYGREAELEYGALAADKTKKPVATPADEDKCGVQSSADELQAQAATVTAAAKPAQRTARDEATAAIKEARARSKENKCDAARTALDKARHALERALPAEAGARPVDKEKEKPKDKEPAAPVPVAPPAPAQAEAPKPPSPNEAAVANERWGPAYSRIEDALALRGQALAIATDEDKPALATAETNMGKARGAWKVQDYAAAEQYATAATGTYRAIVDGAKKRAAANAPDAAKAAKDADSAIREARFALDDCAREVCDDRDAAAYTRGKRLLESAEQASDQKDFAYAVELAKDALKKLKDALAAPRKNAPKDPAEVEKQRVAAAAAVREAEVQRDLCKAAGCADLAAEDSLRATKELDGAKDATTRQSYTGAKDLADRAAASFKAALAKVPKLTVPPGVTHVQIEGRRLVINPQPEFANGTSTLSPQSAAVVKDVATVLKANSALVGKVTVTGHTDNVGDAASNTKLSLARAQAIATALQAQGIAASLIAVDGKGSTMPIADNATAEGKKANRRVEINVDFK